MEPLPLEFAWHSKGKDVFVEALLFLQSAALCATGQTRAARLQGAAPESRGRERGAAPRAPCAGNCARFGCLALASCRRTALLPPRLLASAPSGPRQTGRAASCGACGTPRGGAQGPLAQEALQRCLRLLLLCDHWHLAREIATARERERERELVVAVGGNG